jgi:hypothetical protein
MGNESRQFGDTHSRLLETNSPILNENIHDNRKGLVMERLVNDKYSFPWRQYNLPAARD